MSNIDNVLKILSEEHNEMWLRAKIVMQFINQRKKLGYSHQDVANKIGVSKQLISRFERMENSPTLAFIVKYADALDLDVDAILTPKADNNFHNDVVTYSNGEFFIDVNFDYENETIWLSIEDISSLFAVSSNVLSVLINDILTNDVSSCCTLEVNNVRYYNLDVVLLLGYRLNSKHSIDFRRWTLGILKDYIFKGYAVNQKKLDTLNKKIELQNKVLTGSVSDKELLNVINQYEKALNLLDDYDHQALKDVKGRKTIYRLTYQECRSLIDSMKFGDTSSVFGVEKEPGKLNGILDAVYQNVFDTEVYESLESKASHLLYFLVKDHPFVDGCKRIAATIFLEFLNKNKALVRNEELVISNEALAAITLLTAESKPEEMDIIISVLMNIIG